MYPKGYMSLPDKVAGGETVCETCGHNLVCRMTVYNNYANYLQWQNADQNTAHFDSSGKCKTLPGDRRTQKEEPDPYPEPNPLANIHKQIQQKLNQNFHISELIFMMRPGLLQCRKQQK